MKLNINDCGKEFQAIAELTYDQSCGEWVCMDIVGIQEFTDIDFSVECIRYALNQGAKSDVFEVELPDGSYGELKWEVA